MANRNRKFVTERTLRSNSDHSEESDSMENLVANENSNNGSDRSNNRKRNNNDKTGAPEAKKIKKVKKKHKSGKDDSKDSQKNNKKATAIQFVEEERLIQMSVTPEDDQFSDEELNQQSTGSIDNDSQLPPLIEQESSDEGLIESESDEQIEENDGEISFNFNREINDKKIEQENKDKEIRKIDAEMKQKLVELKRMMEQGGFKESARILSDFPMLNDKGGRIGQEKRHLEDTHSNSNQGTNQNVNNVNVKVMDKSVAGDLRFSQNSKQSGDGNLDNSINSKSLETIYESAVPNRDSTSSEDEMLVMNSSDESFNALQLQAKGDYNAKIPSDKQIEDFIVDTRESTGLKSRIATQNEMGPPKTQQPTTSRHQDGMDDAILTTEEKIQNMIRDAERAKAKIFATQGNDKIPSAYVDESYIVVGGHLDENMINKIIKGDYVDFGKLLPRDKITTVEEDGRMEMYCKNGRTFWSPVTNAVTINGFAKWEQAFRVFSNIYSKANPSRASELIEYNHIIHTISQAYIWDNVYLYDKEFRLHMARNPTRSWSMILQQAWSLKLRDRIMGQNTWANSYPTSHGASRGNGNTGNTRFNEPCHRFNRGKCNFGTNCKYEHRCSYCYKFGHSSVNCRKAQTDRDRKSGGNNNFGDKNQNGNGHAPVQESTANGQAKN